MAQVNPWGMMRLVGFLLLGLLVLGAPVAVGCLGAGLSGVGDNQPPEHPTTTLQPAVIKQPRVAVPTDIPAVVPMATEQLTPPATPLPTVAAANAPVPSPTPMPIASPAPEPAQTPAVRPTKSQRTPTPTAPSANDGWSELASYDLRQDGYLRSTQPERERMISDLVWVADGIANPDKGSVSEMDAVQGLIYLAVNGGSAFFDVVEHSWVQDGRNKPAMESLGHLAQQYPDKLAQLMAHPAISDGINDDEAKIIAVLWTVQRYNPQLVDTLLDPDKVFLEERTIILPLAGAVHLTLVRTRPGAERSMDVIEGALRGTEEFMSAPFPQRDLILLFEDALPEFAGGLNSKTHTTIRPTNDADEQSADAALALHVHELASYYWTSNEQWIVQGAEVLLDTIVGNVTPAHPIIMRWEPCAYAGTIAELESLAAQKGDAEFRCNYILGGRIFHELYRNMDELTFRQGFRRLYLLAQHDDDGDDCQGISAGICHLEAAFKTDVTEEVAAVVDRAIARWYHGTVPSDLSYQDDRPVDPVLPSINGRIDRAWVSTERGEGPAVASISASDRPDSLYINLMYSYDDHHGPDRLTLQSVQYFEGDGFYFNRDLDDSINVAGSAASRRKGFSLGSAAVNGPPGRYWVYVYLGEQKLAQVSYEITP